MSYWFDMLWILTDNLVLSLFIAQSAFSIIFVSARRSPQKENWTWKLHTSTVQSRNKTSNPNSWIKDSVSTNMILFCLCGSGSQWSTEATRLSLSQCVCPDTPHCHCVCYLYVGPVIVRQQRETVFVCMIVVSLLVAGIGLHPHLWIDARKRLESAPSLSVSQNTHCCKYCVII